MKQSKTKNPKIITLKSSVGRALMKLGSFNPNKETLEIKPKYFLGTEVRVYATMWGKLSRPKARVGKIHILRTIGNSIEYMIQVCWTEKERLAIPNGNEFGSYGDQWEEVWVLEEDIKKVRNIDSKIPRVVPRF